MLLATESVNFPLLSALVVLPAIGAAVVALIPSRRADAARVVGLLFSTGTLALVAYTIINFQVHPASHGANPLDPANNGFQFIDKVTWLKQWDISWYLGVDGISLWLAALTALLVVVALLGAQAKDDPKSFTGWILLLEFGCLGGFLALDLFLFFVMFELVLAPMYFLIVGWGESEQRKPAAMKFFLYTMFGSAFMLVAMIVLVVLSARHSGHVTFDLIALANTPGIAQTTGRWLFLGFAIAFAVKMPLVPFHTWLPDTYTLAPTAGSILVSGVMAKLGAYGFLRYGVYLFPEASTWFGPLMVTLGTIGILYGAILAAVQKDLKRVIAYSSVAHLGFIGLGLFAITRVSMTGAVVQMINHGIVIAALFLLVWYVEQRRGSRAFTVLGGMQKRAPILAGLFIFSTFASIGLPGLNGFVGEFMIMIGSFPTRRWWTVIAATGVILAAVYLLWAFQQTFHGMPGPDSAEEKDLRWAEIGPLVPLVAVILFIGLYPRPILDRIQPSVELIEQHVEATTDFRPPVPGSVVLTRTTGPVTEEGEEK